MNAKFVHTNFNVFDLEKSVDFYQQALGLTEVRRKNAPNGSFTLVYLGDGQSDYQLELTWLRDRKEPYALGDNETHIAFRVNDKKEAYALHKHMDCICYENHEMDLYFIADPDGYWIEIVD